VAEELRNTERYLALEQARFGERLAVRLRVAPEVLPVAVPFLVIQPLVENAVRHGLEGAAGRVTVTITAADEGNDAVLTVEDDGAARSDLSSLRLLGSVGEPINPEAWMWCRRVVGGERTPSSTRGGRRRRARS